MLRWFVSMLHAVKTVFKIGFPISSLFLVFWYLALRATPQNSSKKSRFPFARFFTFFSNRRGPHSLFRLIQTLEYLFLTRDRQATFQFLSSDYHQCGVGMREKLSILKNFARTTWDVRGFHSNSEMFVAADRVLKRAASLTEAYMVIHPPPVRKTSRASPSKKRVPPMDLATAQLLLGADPTHLELDVVECGCALGSSSAKISYVVGLVERTMQKVLLHAYHRPVAVRAHLFVYDSFQGIPPNDEIHEQLSFGKDVPPESEEEVPEVPVRRPAALATTVVRRHTEVIDAPAPSPSPSPRPSDAAAEYQGSDGLVLPAGDAPADTKLAYAPAGQRVPHPLECRFMAGSFKGRLASVTTVVTRYGCIRVTSFRKGWFDDSLPLPGSCPVPSADAAAPPPASVLPQASASALLPSASASTPAHDGAPQVTSEAAPLPVLAPEKKEKKKEKKEKPAAPRALPLPLLDVVVLDVDLLSSTRTCLVRLYPLMKPGAFLLSQDGHLKAHVDMMRSPAFWVDEVLRRERLPETVTPATLPPEYPTIVGLGQRKFVEIIRPLDCSLASAPSRQNLNLMKIVLQDSGAQRLGEITVESSGLVSDLKAQIPAGLVPAQSLLVFRGAVLHDGQSLSACDLTDGSCVVVFQRMPRHVYRSPPIPRPAPLQREHQPPEAPAPVRADIAAAVQTLQEMGFSEVDDCRQALLDSEGDIGRAVQLLTGACLSHPAWLVRQPAFSFFVGCPGSPAIDPGFRIGNPLTLSLPGSPRVGACADGGRCSFAVTGPNMVFQPVFMCATCQLTGTKGICAACKASCHAGHDVRFSHHGSFYCGPPAT
ncbi:hypothetical protein PAPYR_9788 [Paratrimastix pyriformis]|uniref:Ubiquitin-like domain-containing protein n=1 Tax=Paratrimastix pyriformis TaxID=342808 RepID=A0ABQ8U7K2_9EUKA|nr:hypothetical protein PAPYR_9788 [Paratrimastix pyriformis]